MALLNVSDLAKASTAAAKSSFFCSNAACAGVRGGMYVSFSG